MKRHLGLSSIVGGGAIALLISQPVWAQATQVTGVRLNQTSTGVEVILETRDGERPQIFTVSRGNALVADIINTQLQLPQGNGFLQNNPASGISSITVTQLDANSVRVTVNGETGAPVGQVTQREEGVVLSFTSGANGQIAQAPATPQAPLQAPAQTQTPPSTSAPTPNVLVPNPQVTIDGVPIPQVNRTYTPPLQPRAFPPPLGDIAVSNIDSTPTAIDLGTSELVPRLVLRDAPVRDVLSLLARAAGLNVAYIDGSVSGDPSSQAGGDTSSGVRISLDIENEPVQDVFNYVLRVSGLEANRTGRTIFVSPRLPDNARSIVTRTLRLNQVTAAQAAGFLSAQGAETQRVVETTTRTVEGEGANQVVTNQSTVEIVPLAATQGVGPLILRGLSVLTDERLNAITLVGDPRKVEIASNFLAQLDLRQRQVAINVKIVDVNLLATEDFNTSFSFGAGDGFFLIDGGAAVLNYGGTNPPNAATAGGSLLSPPVITNPFSDAEPFLDGNGVLTIPNGGGGVIDTNGNFTPTDATFLLPGQPLGADGNPLNPGITDFDPGDPTVLTRDPETGVITVTQGTGSEITTALPSLFQFPTRFLASLQSQIVSGNAKILTDPTLVVQEGQSANVVLAQDVITNITVSRDITDAGISETREFERQPAGLTLNLSVSRIDDNGFITLQVNPTVTSPAQTFDTGDGELILLARRELQSGQVRIRDGQTLILSGIIQESDRTTVSKVPILGDLPIIGALFRSTNRENSRQEVIVLLTPQVIDDSDRSNFGYSYTPGQDVQQLLRQQGIPSP